MVKLVSLPAIIMLDTTMIFDEHKVEKDQEEETFLTIVYNKSTQNHSNQILDQCLEILSSRELKLLLVIMRQTNSWIDNRTGSRKTRDRIS